MSLVNTEVKGDKLVITIDISDAAVKAAQPSASGKTRLVASTRGFMPVSSNLSLSLNLNTK